MRAYEKEGEMSSSIQKSRRKPKLSQRDYKKPWKGCKDRTQNKGTKNYIRA